MLNKLRNLNFQFDPRAALVVFGTLLVGALLGWMLRGALLSPANVTTEGVYDDWHAGCAARNANPGDCEMSVVAADANGVAAARIVFGRQDGARMMIVTLPLGVALQAGIGLSFDKNPTQFFQYRTCNNNGCIITVPVDDKLAASFAQGKIGHVIYYYALQPDQKPTTAEFSLSGYNDALSALNSGERKRSSFWWRLWS